jgi:hypothetical protein
MIGRPKKGPALRGQAGLLNKYRVRRNNVHIKKTMVIMAVGAATVVAQKTPRPVQAQSTSSFKSEVNKDGQRTVDSTNVVYDLSWSGAPGRPADERLVLRKTTRSRQVIDEKGMEATTTVDAWPLGTDFKQKPSYSIGLSATDCRTVNADLLEFDRGLEEIEWWSLYKLGSGQHMFDTYVPLVKFSISREVVTQRYVGLEVPPDDASDARLKDPQVVAVLTYASPEKVIREALITADDPKKAQILRSYWDASRTVTLVEREQVAAGAARSKKPLEPARSLRILISQNYPSTPQTVTIVIPIVKDDLDLAHATLPLRMHAKAWVR